MLATPLRQAKQMGYVLDSKVLDIDNLDLAMGKMMEQGPVLVLTFNSQQILCVKDREGKVVEGSADKVGTAGWSWLIFYIIIPSSGYEGCLCMGVVQRPD